MNRVTFLGGTADSDDQTATAKNGSTAAMLIVDVPQGAVTGPVRVAMDKRIGDPAQSAIFTVPGSVPVNNAPTISSIDPSSGAVGTSVTIMGTNFSATEANNTVTFLGGDGDDDNQEATIASASETALVFTVPANAQTGEIQVTVQGSSQSARSSSFSITTGSGDGGNGDGGSGGDGGGDSSGSIYFHTPLVKEGIPSLYPNPSSDEVGFEGLSSLRSYSYEIYSLVGQRLLSGSFRGDESIDVSKLAPAHYVILVENEGEIVVRTQLVILR